MAIVSHNLQQRRGAEAGDVKFAVEQRMGAAVMLLQEVRNWPGGQGVLFGYGLYTDIDLDTAFAIPRDFACDWHCLGFGSSSLSWGCVSR